MSQKLNSISARSALAPPKIFGWSGIGVIILLCFLLLASTPVQAQHVPVVGLRAHYGFVLIHSRHLRPIKDSYPQGIELDLARHNLSQKAWEFCNCYPRSGLALTFWNFDNRPILGFGLTAVAYMEPIYLTWKPINLSLRFGGGLSYQSRPYHPVNNPDNHSYSTYIAFPLMFNAGFNVRISPQYNLRLTASYNHISNGGVKLPNKGINYPTASLGLDYSLEPIDFQERDKFRRTTPPEKRNRLYIAYLASFKNAFPGSTAQYYIHGLWLKYARHIGRSSALTAGTEFVDDYSRKARIDHGNLDLRHERGSVFIGHEFWMGRVVFGQAIGIYYFDQFQVNRRWYQRYDLIFRVTDRWFTGISLKSHLHVADFLDLRAGFIF